MAQFPRCLPSPLRQRMAEEIKREVERVLDEYTHYGSYRNAADKSQGDSLWTRKALRVVYYTVAD